MTRTMMGAAVVALLLFSGSVTTWAQAAPPAHTPRLTLDSVSPPNPHAQPASGAFSLPTHRYPRKGLMLTGWIMLASSYIVTVVTGVMDREFACIFAVDGPYGDSSYSDCRRRGTLMLIPLVGPWLAMKEPGSSAGKLGLAVLGIGEGLGLLLGIIGTVLHIADKRRFATAARGMPLGGRWAIALTTVGGGPAPAPLLQLSTLLH